MTRQRRHGTTAQKGKVGSYPHFGELALVRVERDEDLVGELVAQILAQNLNVLRLDRHQVVAGPLGLVHL